MGDAQAISLVLAILFLGSVIGYFGLSAARPTISNRRLFWYASILPSLFLPSAILLHDHLSTFPDGLDNPFTHFGTDFEPINGVIYLVGVVVCWIPCAATVLLLRRKRGAP